MISAASVSHTTGDPSPDNFYRRTLNSIRDLPLDIVEEALWQFKCVQEEWKSLLPIRVRKFIAHGFDQGLIQCADVIVIQDIMRKVSHPSTKEMDNDIEARIESLFQELSDDSNDVIPDEYGRQLELFKEMISLEQIQMIMTLVGKENTLSNRGKFQLLEKIRHGLSIIFLEEGNYNRASFIMGCMKVRKDIQLNLFILSTLIKMMIPLIKREDCSNVEVERLFKKAHAHVEAFKPQTMVLLEVTFPDVEQRFNFTEGLLVELKKIEDDEKKSRAIGVISLLIQTVLITSSGRISVSRETSDAAAFDEGMTPAIAEEKNGADDVFVGDRKLSEEMLKAQTIIPVEDPNRLLEFIRKQMKLFSQPEFEKLTKKWLAHSSQYRNDIFNLLKPQFKSPYDAFLVMIEWHSILTSKGGTIEVASDLVNYVQSVEPTKRDLFSSFYLALCSHGVEQNDPLFKCSEEEAILFLFLNEFFSFEELPKVMALILYDPPEKEPSSSNLKPELGPKAPTEPSSITNYAKAISELLVQMPREERIHILTLLGYLFKGTSYGERKELLEAYVKLFADHVQSASKGVFFNKAQQVFVNAVVDLKKRYNLLLQLQPLLESLPHSKRILLLKALETYLDEKYDPKKIEDLYQLRPLFTNANTLHDFQLLIESFKRIPEDKKEQAMQMLLHPNINKPWQLALSIATLCKANVANESLFEAIGLPEVAADLQETPFQVGDWEEFSGYLEKGKPEDKHLKMMMSLFQKVRSMRQLNPKLYDESLSILLQLACEGKHPLKSIKSGFKEWLSLNKGDREMIVLFVQQYFSRFPQTLQHYLQYLLAAILFQHVFKRNALHQFLSQLSRFERAEWQEAAPLLAIIDQVDFFNLGDRIIDILQQNKFSSEMKITIMKLMCEVSAEDSHALYELLALSQYIPHEERPLFTKTAIAMFNSSKEKGFKMNLKGGLYELVHLFRLHSFPYRKLNQWMELFLKFPEQQRSLVVQRLKPLIPYWSGLTESMIVILSGILARDGEIETALNRISGHIENQVPVNVLTLAIKLMIDYAMPDKKPEPQKPVDRNWSELPESLRCWFVSTFGPDDDENKQFALDFLNSFLLQTRFRDVKIGKQEMQWINSLDTKQWQNLICSNQVWLCSQYGSLLQKIAINKRKEIALLIVSFGGNIPLEWLSRFINSPEVLRNSARLMEECNNRMHAHILVELVALLDDHGEFLVRECLSLLKPLDSAYRRYQVIKEFQLIQSRSREVAKKDLLHLLVVGGFESRNILLNDIPPNLLSDFVRYSHLLIEGFKPSQDEVNETMRLVTKGFLKNKERLFKRLQTEAETEVVDFPTRLDRLRLSEEVTGPDLYLVNDLRYFLTDPMDAFEVFSVTPVENPDLHQNEYMDLFRRIVKGFLSKHSLEQMQAFLFYSMAAIVVERKLNAALATGKGLDRALQVKSAFSSIVLTPQGIIKSKEIIPFLKLFHGYSFVNIEDALILLGKIDSKIIEGMMGLLHQATKESPQVLLILEAMVDIPREYHMPALLYIREMFNGRTPQEIALLLYLVRNIFERGEDVEIFKMVGPALVEDSHAKIREHVQIFCQIASEERLSALDFLNDYCRQNEAVDAAQMLLALKNR